MVSWISSHLVGQLCSLPHAIVGRRMTAELPKWLEIEPTSMEAVVQLLVLF